MPDIANPQVVRFCNDKVRPLADAVHIAYFEAVQLVQDFASGDIGGALGKADSGDLVADGSETDGRTRLSRQDIEYSFKLLTEFIAFLDGEVGPGQTRLSIISKAHVNG